MNIAVKEPQRVPPAVSQGPTLESFSVRRSSWMVKGEKYGLLIVIAIAVLVFSALAPETFPTLKNLGSMLSAQAVVGIIALGLLVPLLTGNFDLSVGTLSVVSAVVAASMMQNHGFDAPAAIAVAIIVCLVLGAVNGFLVAVLHLDGLIATLATSTILTGFISFYTNNQSITQNISPWISDFGRSRFFGFLPGIAILTVLCALVIWFIVSQTPLGRKLVSIGSNPEAAKLVGINVRRLTGLSFVLSSGLGAIAGVALLSQQGAGNPSVNGLTLLLPALAAVFLGASSWTPGQFNVPGTLFGLALVAVIVSGLALMGAQPWVQNVVNGALLAAAVGVSTSFRRMSRGS